MAPDVCGTPLLAFLSLMIASQGGLGLSPPLFHPFSCTSEIYSGQVGGGHGCSILKHWNVDSIVLGLYGPHSSGPLSFFLFFCFYRVYKKERDGVGGKMESFFPFLFPLINVNKTL